jgi:hypothetical protein
VVGTIVELADGSRALLQPPRGGGEGGKLGRAWLSVTRRRPSGWASREAGRPLVLTGRASCLS